MQASKTIKFQSRYKQEILIGILIIFYTVGMVGLLLPAFRDSFLKMSAMNLWLSFIILLIARKSQYFKFILFLFICFLTGMAAEWIGIHTGLLFGDYVYGSNLGAKFDGVPYIIGINWGILSVISCAVISKFLKANIFIKALLSAFLMMMLDFLIEPVAIKSGYWHWNSPSIPLSNYICWFAISFPLHLAYFKWKMDEQNKVSIALFIIMVIFFAVLNIN